MCDVVQITMQLYNGNLHMVQSYVLSERNVDLNKAFELACVGCYLHLAQWLYSIRPPIKVHRSLVFQVYDFSNAPPYARAQMCKWLLMTVMDVSDVFIEACAYGVVNIARLCLSVKPDVDVTVKNDYAFRTAVYHYFSRTINLLCLTYPSRWYTLLNKKDGIYQINDGANCHIVRTFVIPIYNDDDDTGA